MFDNYGRRLIPNVLRQEAKVNPQRTFAVLTRSNEVADGFDSVTFQQVARAANYLSCWLQDRFEHGQQPSSFPTLAYVGGPEICYSMIAYASMQCRYKVFFISPRNPTAVNISLLEQTKCSRFVYTDQVASVAESLQHELPTLQCERMPSFQALLEAPDRQYNYDLEYEQAFRDPVAVLHSSGSTGQPKAITFTHGTCATWDIRDWPTVPGRVNHDSFTTIRLAQPDSRFYDVFPVFHLAGFLRKVLAPVYIFAVPIIGPPTRPPSGVLAAEIIRSSKAAGAVLPPSIVEQLSHQSDSEALFKQLNFLLYSGGALPDEVGSRISRLTKLCQMYGSTEIGQIRQLAPTSEDWAYLEFHPNEKFEFREASDGLSELVMLSGPDLERSSALYHNFPHITEYRTKDLFEPHPNKAGLWKFKARNDDILVFSSGEKLNPIPFELSVTANPNVAGAIILGQGYAQSALLIELASATTSSTDPIQDLWPAIETANTFLPGHGRISRNMVMIATPERPFVRAGKGSVVRRATEQLYKSDIQHLYDVRKETPKTPAKVPLKPSAFRLDDVKALLYSILEQVSIGDQVSDADSFYTVGMDSIKTAEAVSHLKASMQSFKPDSDLDWLIPETFYLNSSIDQLAPVILSFLNDGVVWVKSNRVVEMEAMIAKYTNDSRRLQTTTKKINPDGGWNIALTGTTGFLGGHLLRQLLTDPRVSRVYCLNRSSNARKEFEESYLTHDKEVLFMKIDFSSPRLGLQEEEYTRLLRECQLIMHNAWRIDFNLSLNSFDDHLHAVKCIIDLALQSAFRITVLFVSSVSATGIWASKGAPQRTIPEAIVQDLDSSVQRGYGESKLVAEHIFNFAATESKIPISVVRMGQIVPSDGEQWSQDDIIPLFFKTCKALGILASDFADRIDWIPVDNAAEVLINVAQHDLSDARTPDLQVYNFVSPQQQSWGAMMDTVREWCGTDVKVMSMRQWVEEVKKEDTGDAIQMARLPALRILKSFEQMVERGPSHRYAMDNLMQVAGGSARKISPVTSAQLRHWLNGL